MSVQEAVSAQSPVFSSAGIDAMLAGLPTAHRAPPIGCRGTQPGFGQSSKTARAPRLRFVYFPVADDNERHAAYHQHLVTAEVLFGRVLAACSTGLRPIAPALDYAAEARASVRPPRSLFHATTLEYRRWYERDGSVRPEPLTREALTAQLVADGLSMEDARHRAAHRSHALAAVDQAWLIDRRKTPLDHRPLNQAEFHTLVDAIEGAYQVPAGASPVEQANGRIALRVAAMLGSLLDEFAASPFRIAALSQAFSEIHLAHLRRSIESSRQAESDSGVLLAGPKAWFAAKAARMRAEHQIGLAMSPGTFPAIRLSTYPVVAVVGGKLRTFVDGWRHGRSRLRAADAVPAFAIPTFAAIG
ncbi:MAG: hypothetical protein ACREPQ_08435 [Rhodanobacter sp.]